MKQKKSSQSSYVFHNSLVIGSERCRRKGPSVSTGTRQGCHVRVQGTLTDTTDSLKLERGPGPRGTFRFI